MNSNSVCMVECDAWIAAKNGDASETNESNKGIVSKAMRRTSRSVEDPF
ncbi:MAG TPA: hypothetical protein PLY87_08170 [Planctomycetaceae bacterium]|nr:hypothetical protein [Planctomycetaceae bacterium]